MKGLGDSRADLILNAVTFRLLRRIKFKTLKGGGRERERERDQAAPGFGDGVGSVGGRDTHRVAGKTGCSSGYYIWGP